MGYKTGANNRGLNATAYNLRFLFTLLVIVFSVTGCSSSINSVQNGQVSKDQNVSDNKTVTIGLTYVPNIQFSPFYIAEDKNYFPENIKLRHHGASEGLFDALLNGNEDFVIAGADEMVKAMDSVKNLDLVAVAPYYRKYPLAIFASKNIKSPKDLIGKTIGIPGKYGENWFALLLFLKENGITEQQVEIKEIGYTQLSALKTGQVDAVVGYTNNDYVQMLENNMEVSTIALSEKSVPLISASVVTTREFLNQNPEIVKTVVQGISKGIDFVQANLDETVQITAKNYVPDLDKDSNKRVVLKVLKQTNLLFDREIKITNDDCKKMLDFMYSEKLITQKPANNVCIF